MTMLGIKKMSQNMVQIPFLGSEVKGSKKEFHDFVSAFSPDRGSENWPTLSSVSKTKQKNLSEEEHSQSFPNILLFSLLH